MDIDVRADMLKGIAGLNLGEQLERIEGVKSEFKGLLSKDETIPLLLNLFSK
jgi:hypothetical protein